MTFSKILRTAFGEGGVRGFPKRLVAGMRQGFRTVSKDPIHGPTLRAARYESIDGANEIGWGTALLCFALPSYTYLVFPPSSIWKARLGWLLLVCAALAPFGCRWFIKRFITWPRTGYVAFRRDRKFWIAIGMSVILSAVLGAVLPWLMMTEITRRTQLEMRQEGAPLSPINTNKLSRAYLGVRLQSLSPNAAKPIQQSRQKPGVLVPRRRRTPRAILASTAGGTCRLHWEIQGFRQPHIALRRRVIRASRRTDFTAFGRTKVA